MKAIVLAVLSVVLVLHLTTALPINGASFEKLRLRRDVQNTNSDLELSPEAAKKREDLEKYLVLEMILLVNESVSNQKKLFENVVEAAKESDLKSPALDKHLRNFTDLIERAKDRTDLDSEEDLSELFDLFTDFSAVGDSYDDIENPSEEEKLLKRLLDENGGPQYVIKFLIDFLNLRNDFEKNAKEYVDSLSEEDKKKDSKLVDWYYKFKNSKDIDSFVDTTLEVFDILSGDEDEESKN